MADYADFLRTERDQIQRRLEAQDFKEEEGYLGYLRESGHGPIDDPVRAAPMLAAVSLQAVEKALAKFSGPEVRSVVLGSERMRESADRATPSSNAPVVSKYLETYLANKKPSKEVADSLRATVRDFAAVVGDKPIDAYLPEDGTEFVSFLLTQPSNWMKIRELRALDVISAAKQAQALGCLAKPPTRSKRRPRSCASCLRQGRGVTRAFKSPSLQTRCRVQGLQTRRVIPSRLGNSKRSSIQTFLRTLDG
jgi:hypothetical protein